MGIQIDIEKKLSSFLLDIHLDSEKYRDGGRPEVIGLLGASGSGKTQTLKCIAGIVRPDRGRILVDGETWFDSGRKICLSPQERGVGYVFQNYALFPNMTVEQNIACGIRGADMQRRLHSRKKTGARNSAAAGREDVIQKTAGERAAAGEAASGGSEGVASRLTREMEREKIADICRRMHIDGLEKRKPHQLSGGQQQRAALARILAGDPRLILLDEPFSALDEYLRDQMLDETMRAVEDAGVTTLFVTHSRSEARRAATAIAVLHDGKIEEDGLTEDIFTEPSTYWGKLLTGYQDMEKR